MIGEAGLQFLKNVVAAQDFTPDDIGAYDWFVVPAQYKSIPVPQFHVSELVGADGEERDPEPTGESKDLDIKHRIQFTAASQVNLPFVKEVRFGWDTNARIVLWSIL